MANIEKEIMLRDVKEKVTGKSFFLSNFEGLKVEEIEELRDSVRKSNAACFVVKKTILRKHLDENKISFSVDELKGNILLSAIEEEPQNVSKALVDYSKSKKDKFVVQGVYLDGKMYDSSFVKQLSELPSREELIAKVVGGIKSPITGFVLTLGGIVKSLAVVLNEVKKQKEQQ